MRVSTRRGTVILIFWEDRGSSRQEHLRPLRPTDVLWVHLLHGQRARSGYECAIFNHDLNRLVALFGLSLTKVGAK